MQFHVTYNRPSPKKHWKRLREVSGWRNTTQQHVDNFIAAYELHGFRVNRISDKTFTLTHPKDGIRIVEIR